MSRFKPNQVVFIDDVFIGAHKYAVYLADCNLEVCNSIIVLAISSNQHIHIHPQFVD